MMTTNRNRKLAKGFWPVLLLSAALSLPAASVATPSPNGKAHAADKDDNRNRNKDRKQVHKERQKNQREAQKRQAEAKREAQKRQAEVRRETQKRQAELQRAADQRRRAELQLRQSQARRLELQRQAEIRRQAELRRQAQLQRQYRNNQYRGDSYYRNRFGRYGYRGNGAQEHLDGFVIDDRGECVLFREHRTGQIFALAGNIHDMREGDHIRYRGVHTYDQYCGSGYPTMEVREIKTVWSNDRHDYPVYDANRDGYYERWADRHYGYN